MKTWIVGAFALTGAAAMAQQAVQPSEAQGEVATQERDATMAPEGKSMAPAEVRARRTLEDAGYRDIRDMRQEGDGWSAATTYQGQQVKVRIDRDGKPVKSPA